MVWWAIIVWPLVSRFFHESDFPDFLYIRWWVSAAWWLIGFCYGSKIAKQDVLMGLALSHLALQKILRYWAARQLNLISVGWALFPIKLSNIHVVKKILVAEHTHNERILEVQDATQKASFVPSLKEFFSSNWFPSWGGTSYKLITIFSFKALSSHCVVIKFYKEKKDSR